MMKHIMKKLGQEVRKRDRLKNVLVYTPLEIEILNLQWKN